MSQINLNNFIRSFSVLFIFYIPFFFIASCRQGVPTESKSESMHSKEIEYYSKFSQGTIEKDKYYDLILQNYPQSDKAWMSKSVSYNKRGRIFEGFKFLNFAVCINPREHLGYRGFVKLYMMHDYEGALADYVLLDSLTRGLKPDAWGEDLDKVIGMCYLQTGEFLQAEISFKDAIKRVSEKYGKEWVDPRTFLYLGISLFYQKEYNEAILVLDDLLELHPRYTEAYYYKAQVLFEVKKNSEALNMMQKCKDSFLEFGVVTNPYFEVPFQIYLSQINLKLKK